jgi:hypothetical protein
MRRIVPWPSAADRRRAIAEARAVREAAVRQAVEAALEAREQAITQRMELAYAQGWVAAWVTRDGDLP